MIKLLIGSVAIVSAVLILASVIRFVFDLLDEVLRNNRSLSR